MCTRTSSHPSSAGLEDPLVLKCPAFPVAGNPDRAFAALREDWEFRLHHGPFLNALP